jgi:hypothetical protein
MHRDFTDVGPTSAEKAQLRNGAASGRKVHAVVTLTRDDDRRVVSAWSVNPSTVCPAGRERSPSRAQSWRRYHQSVSTGTEWHRGTATKVAPSSIHVTPTASSKRTNPHCSRARTQSHPETTGRLAPSVCRPLGAPAREHDPTEACPIASALRKATPDARSDRNEESILRLSIVDSAPQAPCVPRRIAESRVARRTHPCGILQQVLPRRNEAVAAPVVSQIRADVADRNAGPEHESEG